jgi:hypothetical protein
MEGINEQIALLHRARADGADLPPLMISISEVLRSACNSDR